MRALTAGFLAACVAGLAAHAGPAAAHPLAPSLLELREEDAGRVHVLFRTPRLARPGAALAPELPADCRAQAPPTLATDATSATFEWVAECGSAGLRGATLRVHGLRESRTDALVRVELIDGELVRGVLRPESDAFVVPSRSSRAGVVAAYLALGFEHLLTGVDHLLFVLGLVLLLRDGRRLVQAVTGFTLGHSVTLSLATLGWVRVPSLGVEIAIAASLFWLATRLARAWSGGGARGLAHPWRPAAAFGLLHGLGFAGALAQAGLPAGEIPLALFAFNFGIELGQLGVVAALLAARAALRPWSARAPVWLARIPAYAIGATAAALVFERAAAGLL